MRGVRGDLVELMEGTGCAYGAHKGTPLHDPNRLQASGRPGFGRFAKVWGPYTRG